MFPPPLAGGLLRYHSFLLERLLVTSGKGGYAVVRVCRSVCPRESVIGVLGALASTPFMKAGDGGTERDTPPPKEKREK